MSILSLGEVPQLNQLLLPAGYKIHVHDACGGQSFQLEPLNKENKMATEEVISLLEDFFKNHNMKLHFYGVDKLNFIGK